jgi:hypothetical protein
MSSDLVKRLRGEYRIPITDGHGPAGGDEPNNPKEFVRHFETPPIQKEAAARIEALEGENAALKSLHPEEMAGRKILFDECGKGHGNLRGENWVEHPCQICRAEAAEARAERLRVALEGIAANADTASDLSLFRVQCRDFARKALEDDKQ